MNGSADELTLMEDVTSASTRMIIQEGGNVGIGTASPGNSRLKLQGSDDYYSLYVVNEKDVASGYTQLARFQTSDTTNRGLWVDVYNAGGTGEYVRLGSLGNIPLSILPSGGNVGIGTVSPSSKLEIKSTGAGTYPFRVTASDGGQMGYFYEDTSQHTILDLFDGDGGNDIRLNTNGNSWFTGGNVGIGTASPGEKLDVNGAAAVNLLRLRAQGSVDPVIGSPTIQQVSGTFTYGGVSDYGMFFSQRGTAGGYPARGWIFHSIDDNATAASIRLDGGAYFKGNVGIGTTNPSSGTGGQLKLDVEGKIGATEYCDENGDNCIAAANLGGATYQ